MPPEAITAVMPMAIMPTNAKLRATLKRLRSVAKLSVNKVRARQARTAARKTQNSCWLETRENQLRCSLRAITSSRVVMADPLSGGFNGAGDQACHLFGR